MVCTAGEPAAGLYVHVPFCSAVCPYCDFAVQTARAGERGAFVDALVGELESWGGAWRAPIDTIYLGGGTPSLLVPADLERIFAAARASLPVAAAASIAMEANPEDVDPRRAAAWREAGVETLSLGVQSFDDAELRRLGRRHDGRRSREAVDTALAAGFRTVSVDLIFGLPGQSAAAWRANLEAAAALGPQHLSCYQLTVHEGTTFGRWRDRGKLAEMPEDEQAELFSLAHTFLPEAGWAAYEVSNFAREPWHRSRHNRKYWTHVPYLGVGPSAHSFDGASRWWNERSMGPYSRALAGGKSPVAGSERLTPSDLALEAVMLGLRTVDGIDLGRFERRYGVDLLDRNRELIERLEEQGYLRLESGVVHPTVSGLAVADGLSARFDLG